MITKEEKIKIFEETIMGLRKKFLPSNKDRLNADEIIEKKTEKFRRLPLD